MKKRNLLALTLALILSLSVITPTASAQADVVGKEECFPAVLMLKGSGEGNDGTGAPVLPKTYAQKDSDTPFIKTNGHEGAVLSKLLQGFVNKTDPAETVSKVRFIGIEYPALPVFPEVNYKSDESDFDGRTAEIIDAYSSHVISYHKSYTRGAEMVVEAIQADKNRGCETKYMLLSYSQGVISARIAINLLDHNKDLILMSYAIGDPFQKANAAKAPRQRSDSSVAYNRNGVGHSASTVASLSDILVKQVLTHLSPGNLGTPLVFKTMLERYRSEINSADSIIYNQDGDSGYTSRSLCHDFDLVCSTRWSMNEGFAPHLNYFEEDDDPLSTGAQDLVNEVPAFNEQVKMLAESSLSNPRERALTATPAVQNEDTIFNVANARADDTCSWDYDSDGVYEVSDQSCGLKRIKQTALTSNVSVEVTDSFGTKHLLTSEVQAVSAAAVRSIKAVQLDTWVSLRNKPDYAKCVQWQQDPELSIDITKRVGLDSQGFAGCGFSKNNTKTAADALRLFKLAPYQTSTGVKYRFISGYDDRYALEAVGTQLFLREVSSSTHQDIGVLLVGNTEYAFKHIVSIGNKCMQAGKSSISTTVTLGDCNVNKQEQHFTIDSRATQKYGDLSVERDSTPPTKIPEGFSFTIQEYSGLLQWGGATDNRIGYVTYELAQLTGNGYQVIQSAREMRNATLDFSTWEVGANQSFRVTAIDAAGNRGEPTYFEFTTPPWTPKTLGTPVLVSNVVANSRRSTTFTLPDYDADYIVEVRKNSGAKLIANSSSFTYVDYVSSSPSRYDYRLKIAESVFTTYSSQLTVTNQ